MVSGIVGKTRWQHRHVCAIFQACCANFWSFFAFCCKNWHFWWVNWHPFSSKGGATCFLMVFHAIWRLILKYRFCAISSRELSVGAIFYAFYNSADHTIHRMQFHIESSICFEILVKHICWHHCKGSTQAVQRGRNQYQCHRHFGGKPFWLPSSANYLSSKINLIQW